jgi:TonB family protein
VNFLLDRAGNLVNVALVRSTGDRELDVEALALVRRAAPFPKPPVGVLLSFTPIIFFGEDEAR